ncbi:MAG: DUF1805 domain-containing protein [Candidatus Micrarchaeota archaeon]
MARRSEQAFEVAFEGKSYAAMQQKMGNLPLIVIKAKSGYVACSYIDKETAEKVGDIAAFVAGVKTVEDFKKAKIRSVTTWAENLGIREGMSVKKALELMDAPCK